MAGVAEPCRDLDLVELSENYSYQELMWSESLGLCPFGKGAELLLSGETEIGGEIPINSSGGLLSGIPLWLRAWQKFSSASCNFERKQEAPRS